MLIKANSYCKKISGTLPNIKIIKIIRNLGKRPNTANVHFHFPLTNLQPQTCGLICKFHEELHGHWKCWQRLEGLRIFHSKNVYEPIEYSRYLPLPCFNKFVLTQKNFNCFVRYKATPTLPCKDRRWCLDEGPCSGLQPFTEVGLYVIWESWEEANHNFLFWNKHSRCRRVYTAPATLVKTTQSM